MSWIEQWRALSTRIEGLLRAGDAFTSMYESAGRNDRFNLIGKVFLPELEAIDKELGQFKAAWEKELPQGARDALASYLSGNWTNGLSAGELQALVPIAV